MMHNVLSLDTATYQQHELHGQDRIWVETNCYVDLWIELLHALGLPPQACAAFTLSIDFDDDQFTFFKFPLEDLRYVWGIEVSEMNPWMALDEHLEIQLSKGRLMTVEVDSWFLPDTAGVSYQMEHTKTTIGVQMIDRDARRLGYFHNQGYYEIDGSNYLGALRLVETGADQLTPYTELVKLDRVVRPAPDVIVERAENLVRQHLARRPRTSFIDRFRQQFSSDLDRLVSGGPDAFHKYAFATLRQLGAAAEFAASLTDWLEAKAPTSIPLDSSHLTHVASTAKSMQFKLARAAAGRPVDFEPLLDQLDSSWAAGINVLESRYGG